MTLSGLHLRVVTGKKYNLSWFCLLCIFKKRYESLLIKQSVNDSMAHFVNIAPVKYVVRMLLGPQNPIVINLDIFQKQFPWKKYFGWHKTLHWLALSHHKLILLASESYFDLNYICKWVHLIKFYLMEVRTGLLKYHPISRSWSWIIQ